MCTFHACFVSNENSKRFKLCPFLSFSVVRNQTFHLGSDVRLECNNVTWNDIVYILWNLDLGHKKCVIGFTRSGQSSEGCHDGKMLRNTSSAQLYLHIPKFSKDDVGVYMCESAYKGGRENYLYNVGIKGESKNEVL